MRRLGVSNLVDDHAMLRSLSDPYEETNSAGVGAVHNAVTLDTNLASVMDISSGQVLGADASLARGDLWYADSTPSMARLAHPAAAGYALTTDANDVMWDQTPTWTGEHNFAAGIRMSGASDVNNFTVPDNQAIAFELEDAGGTEYMRVSSSDGQPSVIFNEAGADIDFTIEADGVADAFQILGSDGQITLGALTAGYVKSSAAGVLSIGNIAADVPFAPTAEGDMIIADATPEWSRLATAGAAGYALVSSASSAAWDQTPTWTGDHTWDNGAGDSPKLNFVGGSNDDTASIYLDNDGTAGNSDLVVTLCAADSDSRFIIEDSGNVDVAYIDAEGNADFNGHFAIGSGATVNTSRIINAVETFTNTSGVLYGVRSTITLDPAANFSTTWYGYQGTAALSGAYARTGGNFIGIVGTATISNNVDARNTQLRGGYFWVDVEDAGSGGGAGATAAEGVRAETPRLHTGTITAGYGVRIEQGSVGAGTIATLYGLYVDDITAGTTDYSIFTGTGLVHLGDDVELVDGAYLGVTGGVLFTFDDTSGDITLTGGDLHLASGGGDKLYLRSGGDVATTESDILADTQLGLAAATNVHTFIDANGAGADNTYFAIQKGAEDVASATELLRVTEGGYMGIGTTVPNSKLELMESYVLDNNYADRIAAGLTLDPAYDDESSGYTVTRHNYIDLNNAALAGTAAITDGCALRFDAAAGTHIAVDGSSTKTTPGAVDMWVKINVNGTVRYMPAYNSKTA